LGGHACGYRQTSGFFAAVRVGEARVFGARAAVGRNEFSGDETSDIVESRICVSIQRPTFWNVVQNRQNQHRCKTSMVLVLFVFCFFFCSDKKSKKKGVW
jgi:hypothetical protein